MSKFNLKLEQQNCVNLQDAGELSLADVLLTKTALQVVAVDFVLTMQTSINFTVKVAMFKALSAKNVARSFKNKMFVAVL